MLMKKHILVISQYFYPESFRINDICQEWVKRGYEVTVLTGIPNYPDGKFYPGYSFTKKRTDVWNGIKIIRIPLIPRGKNSIGLVMNYISFVISGFFWIQFTKIKGDYVFTFEVSPMTQALIGVWYSKKHKIPNYLYVQDLWPENVEIVTGINSPVVINPIRKMVNYIYKNSTEIFATSSSFVDEIKKWVLNKNKVHYWPQYAEEIYTPSDSKSELIPQDKVLNITFTGNIGMAQGLEILPDVAYHLKERAIAVRFNIVGDGRGKDNLVCKINMLNVQEYFNMIRRQPIEFIPHILAASDAALLSFTNNPIFAMTIPAKLQSYMACGCPIIALAEGEAKNIIEEAMCGLVAVPGDSEDLAKKIIEFLNLNQYERERMKESAIMYCKQHFDKKTLIEEFSKRYL